MTTVPIFALTTATETTAIVFLSGFAIQQILTIVDPVLVWLIRRWKEQRPTKDLPGGISEADLKKSFMAIASFGLGALVVGITNIRLLTLLKPEYAGVGDFIISSLVIGTGTEAVNTVTKFLGYVKDAQKPNPELELTMLPATVTVKQNTTFRFRIAAKNGSTAVNWSVLQSNGGTIDPSGVYTAPATAGTFHVLAESQTDPTKSATATVTVTT